jgi:hypothetical protein
MQPRPLITRLVVLTMGASLLVAACSAGREEPTPTTSVEQIQTQAAASFAAGLTSTALANPTATPAPTDTPAATGTAPITEVTVPTATRPAVVPTASCYGLTFVSDVSVPDNTQMTPGQEFTKTWRVRNSGSCVWEEGFKFSFTSGEAMGGSTLTLDSAVETGEEVELSVDLTAPNSAGTFRGNWRMATVAGTYFGDEVYVLIIVSGSTLTATAEASATQNVTATATAVPSATQNATATAKPSATQSPTPTESPAPTETPTETASP